MPGWLIIALPFFVMAGIAAIFGILNVFSKRVSKEEKQKMIAMIENSKTMTVEEFFNNKKDLFDIPGVYVFHNLIADMCLVGKSEYIVTRVTEHFTNKGNDAIYNDYQHGAEFKIYLFYLKDTEYDNLDDLKRVLSSKYKAYDTGYNKTSSAD